MDEDYVPDLDRAARRREQNRIAQRNHRRRRQLAQQNPLQQAHHRHQQHQQHQEPQQLWPPDWRTNHEDYEDPLSILFERQPWEEEPTNATSPKQAVEANDNHMGGPQTELLDIFDSLVQSTPSANQHSDPIYSSSSTDNEPPRNVIGTASKDLELQPVLVNHEPRIPNGSCRDSRSRRERLPVPHTSPASSSTLHSSASPTSILGSRSRAQSVVAELPPHSTMETLARYPTRDSRLQRISSPVPIDQVGPEESDRPSPGGRARPSSFHQQPHRRPGERNHDRARAASVDNHGQTCLHLAAAQGSCALVRYFLGRGMRPDTRDGDGLTALHHAIRGGHEDTVNALLLGGADIEVTDSCGRTALHFAVEQRQNDIVVLLVHKGADMHATVPHRIR